MLKNEHLLEVKEAGRAIATLAEDERSFNQAVKAFEAGDRDAFRQALDHRGLLPHCLRICFWLCIWRCVRVCRLVCVELPTAAPTPGELVELARLLVPLRENPDLLKRFTDAMDRGDAQTLGAIVKDLKIQRFCFFVCYWICSLRCRRFCIRICAGPQTAAEADPNDEIRDSIEALAALAKDEAGLMKALDVFRKQDVNGFHSVLEQFGILRLCIIACRFFCYWNCFRICLIVCREIPKIDLTIPELREFGLALGKLAQDEARLTRVNEALVREDLAAWGAIIEELRLGRFCYYLCHWICFVRCDLYCWILCPPGCLTTFRYIGGYNILTGINSTAAGNGLTTADSRAFFLTVRLNGVVCKQHSGGPAEYRFEFRTLPAGAWTPVPPDWIERTEIGLWQSTVPAPPDDVKPYTVKGTAPTDKVATLTVDGWVHVPQESNVNNAGGNFAPNGNLINLNTVKMATWTDLNIAGITAGQSTAPAGLGADKLFGLRLRVRRIGMPATEVTAGTCEKVAVYNAKYDNVTHKGTWAPVLESNQLGVVMVNVLEIGTGCAKITNALTIKYTAAHPNLGPVGITMDGPGGPYGTTLADDGGATPQNRFGTASVVLPPGVTIANLNKCAYLVKMSATILLTTGDSNPDPIWDEVAFCK
jgi:hypothetical protein